MRVGPSAYGDQRGLRILMVSLRDNVLRDNYGGERERLAAYADRAGAICQIVYSGGSSSRGPVRVTDRFAVYPVSGAKVEYPFRAVAIGSGLIRNEALNLIDTQDPAVTGLVGLILNRIHGVPLIVGCHSLLLWDPTYLRSMRGVLERALSGVVLPRCDAVQAASSSGRDFLIASGVPASKIEVIPIPVAIGPLPDDEAEQSPEWDVLYVGRFSAEKDPALLVRALVKLQERGVRIRAAFVGDGPELARCRALAGAAVPGSVHFLGRRASDDIAELMRLSRILVLPSRSESFGRVLVEAGLMGLPVIAADVGGVPDIVEHEVTGLLVPPGDEGALADAIQELLLDEPRARQMGSAAVLRVRRLFSPDTVTDRLVGFWRRVAHA